MLAIRHCFGVDNLFSDICFTSSVSCKLKFEVVFFDDFTRCINCRVHFVRGFLPPPCASSGRPPPRPSANCVNSEIILPACKPRCFTKSEGNTDHKGNFISSYSSKVQQLLILSGFLISSTSRRSPSRSVFDTHEATTCTSSVSVAPLTKSSMLASAVLAFKVVGAAVPTPVALAEVVRCVRGKSVFGAFNRPAAPEISEVSS